MEYDFNSIEKKWQQNWKDTNAYKVSNESDKPSFYVLDMFPYPSGAGLHVGHPLGYIASDIFSRYKRLKGFNVLHPMGFDSFGLPAEQYALETGQHPAVTTEKNIETFKAQLDKIGFCYDWSREVRTSEPSYYKWTQKIFLELFNCYYCNTQQKARPIKDLIEKYATQGNKDFTAEKWNNYSKAEQEDILMERRLAFSKYGEVNWCEALGTVLANDEVVNGVSERGGHPVEKKKMRQWYLRITAYANRLLKGLDTVDFSDAMREMQKNWIGKSEGCEMKFVVEGATDGGRQTTDDGRRTINEGGPTIDNRQQTTEDGLQTNDNRLPTTDDGGKTTENNGSAVVRGQSSINVYTTRPDTIFGVDFLVLAPEHELVKEITTEEQKQSVDEYLTYVKSRSDRERQAEVKQITGCFTGAYATNPFNGKPIPVWIAEYVLAGYGTGAIMAVPCGDQRDFGFAKHFNIPITNIIGAHYTGEEANATKEATLENSDFLNGMLMKDAISIAINKIEELGIGKRKINYRMRDAGFSRQRYWGEPFPIVWEDGVAVALTENDLPLELPYAEKYGPGPNGEGPLGNMTDWCLPNPSEGRAYRRETSTMPGYAGSSWYFLRYMDPNNTETFCDKKASDYWGQVDVYIGGTEHAVGHLLYSRMWTKVLYDLGYIGFEEPFKKLVNQGMITGSSRFVYKLIHFNTLEKVGESMIPKLFDILNPIFLSAKQVFELNGFQHGNDYPTPALERDDELRKEIKQKVFSLANLPHLINDFHATFVVSPIRVNVNFVDGTKLNISEFKKWKNGEFANAEFILEDGTIYNSDSTSQYNCGSEVEKMSKSKYNTVNPDELCDKYGADTFRMYEMFLGPVEQSKPWDTKGIEGVHRFLKKLWRLFYTVPTTPGGATKAIWNNENPTDTQFKILHKTIKKIEQDSANFSYNTAVAAFMIAVNELTDAKCNSKEILSNILILLSPYAPHIAEELWTAIGCEGSILNAAYPILKESYLVEASKEYPVSINGKMRSSITLPTEVTEAEAKEAAMANENITKWLEGKEVKKFIFVKGRMINVVV